MAESTDPLCIKRFPLFFAELNTDRLKNKKAQFADLIQPPGRRN